MQTIRVQLKHFWKRMTLDRLKNIFGFLNGRYELVEDNENPQVIFLSCFVDGKRTFPTNIETDAIKVFITAENFYPNMEHCDFAMSFRRDNIKRHLRHPNYLNVWSHFGLSAEDLLDKGKIPEKKNFCCFLSRNPYAPERNTFFKKLSKHKKVDSWGKIFNNMGSTIGPTWHDKIELLKEYKFVIAYENYLSWGNEGYTTEKFGDAIIANCIPIYRGDYYIGNDFNSKSFINYTDHRSEEEMIERVLKLDKNDSQYADLIAQPWFNDNKIPYFMLESKMRAFFKKIFSKIKEG